MIQNLKSCSRMSTRVWVRTAAASLAWGVMSLLGSAGTHADSVNSPNITMNVDTNRSTGPGAGNVSVAVNTITIAETQLPEYSSGTGKKLTLAVRPGFQFDPTSNITAQSATIGFNGAGVNTAAVLTPSGLADEVLTFNLTSGTNATVQDIIRINGIKLKILSAAGAVGPAQTTMTISTAAAGGAFSNQGVVATTITKGAADHLAFAVQPGTNEAGADLLPTVSIVDFGGNIVNNDPRTITLAIQQDPGSATLQGITQHNTVNGLATWEDSDDLRITTAGTGYTLRATHSGADFLSSDSADSEAFDITAGPPGQLVITGQPADTTAGGDILITVTAQDQFNNPITGSEVLVTLDSAINPGGWPLLVDTSLSKTTVNGVATWSADDHLRINKQVTAYRLSASGLGTPVVSDAFNIAAGAPDHLAITQQPVNGVAGEDILLAVAVQDSFSNVVTAGSVDITLSLATNPGAAILLTSSSLTKPTSNGVATWGAADDLHINIAASGYRLLATSGTSSATSDAFDVQAGAPSALRFVQQPTDTRESVSVDPAVTVEVLDAVGNRTTASVPVTLSLSATSCTAALSGNEATSAAGLATFSDLQIDTPCTADALVASSPGLTDATSQTFAVTPAPVVRTVGVTCGTGAVSALAPLMLMLGLLGRRYRRG